jgi:hypothetical protein
MSERCDYFHDLNGGQKLQCPLALGHAGPHPLGWPGPPPVATQLERIEQGLDKLMQSQTALERDVEQGFLGTYEKLTVLAGRLDAIGAVLAELLAHKPRKTRLRCSKCGLGLKNCKCKVFHSNVRR